MTAPYEEPLQCLCPFQSLSKHFQFDLELARQSLEHRIHLRHCRTYSYVHMRFRLCRLPLRHSTLSGSDVHGRHDRSGSVFSRFRSRTTLLLAARRVVRLSRQQAHSVELGGSRRAASVQEILHLRWSERYFGKHAQVRGDHDTGNLDQLSATRFFLSNRSRSPVCTHVGANCSSLDAYGDDIGARFAIVELIDPGNVHR